MGYSLGDDKESFDVYEKTISIYDNICEELIKNNWIFDNENYTFSKNNRTLSLFLDQDHITSLYILDNSVDWENFIKQHNEFNAIYGNDKISRVEIYISDRTNIKNLINKLEYAPLLEKEKDIEIEFR